MNPLDAWLPNFDVNDTSGFAQAAWSLETRRDGGEVVLRTETRVRCTDEPARLSFLRYWRFIGPFSGLTRREMLRAMRAQILREAGSA